MGEAFYVPDGNAFRSTDWTRGPWDPRSQHAGPPAALVGRAIEGLDPPGLEVARFTLEVLRPIPVTSLRVRAEAVRSGKRVQFVQASLEDERGEVARAGAWRIRPAPRPLPVNPQDPPDIPPPEGGAPLQGYDPWSGPSYFSGMEWRFVRGSLFEPGPAACWFRMGVALIEGEEPSPLTRVLAAADSGNGISMVLPLDRYLFINTELSLHLLRPPEGEWVCLDAVTRIDPRGIGLAESVLWDERGRLGRGNQSLLVAQR